MEAQTVEDILRPLAEALVAAVGLQPAVEDDEKAAPITEPGAQ